MSDATQIIVTIITTGIALTGLQTTVLILLFRWLRQDVQQLDSRINALDNRIDSMEGKVNARIDSLEEKVNARIDAMASALNNRIDNLYQALFSRKDPAA